RHVLAVLDGGHDQGALPVLALHVDGEAEVDVLRRHHVRLAVDDGVVPVHVGEVVQRADHRVPDEVGVGDLAAAGALQVVVDDDPVVGHQLRGHGAHAGGGGDAQRGVHVLGDGR